jgi:thiol-disulfide isomerase/thioredoxin
MTIATVYLRLIVQKFEITPLAQLQNRVAQNNDTLYVINFWATWCKPCVEEMPYFEEVQRQFER